MKKSSMIGEREFLHEVEKRGDKKEKKVIDVMRGKNQVEFNPVTEANVSEDMSGMSQKSGDKRPTDKGADDRKGSR